MNDMVLNEGESLVEGISDEAESVPCEGSALPRQSVERSFVLLVQVFVSFD